MRVFLFVLLATIFESVGDAVIRVALKHDGMGARVGFMLLGTILLGLYGTTLNLAPVEFAEVTGLYVAVLFVVFQITNFIIFRTAPTVPVMVGGALIVAGGMVVSLWH